MGSCVLEKLRGGQALTPLSLEIWKIDVKAKLKLSPLP